MTPPSESHLAEAQKISDRADELYGWLSRYGRIQDDSYPTLRARALVIAMLEVRDEALRAAMEVL